VSSPNPELMHLYGTDVYYLEKTGQLPLLAKALGTAAGFGLYLHDRRHVQQLMEDAEQENQLLRAEEARRMHHVEDAIRGTGGIPFRSRPLPPPASEDLNIPAPMGDPVMLRFERDVSDEMAKGSSVDMRTVAEQVGASMARQYIRDLYKEAAFHGDDFTVILLEKLASGEPLTELEKEALSLSGVGGFLKNLVPKSGTSKFLQAARAEGVAPAAAPGMLSRLRSKLPMSGTKRFIQSAEKEGLGDVARGALKPPKMPAGGPYRTAGLPSAGAAAGAAAPAAGAAAGAAAPATAAAKSKPWLSWKTKAKIGVGAAGLGAGYLGYKALQTGRDYMIQPQQTGGAYGHYGPPVAHDVNPYGYVNPY
jgi:hypothetical protein